MTLMPHCHTMLEQAWAAPLTLEPYHPQADRFLFSPGTIVSVHWAQCQDSARARKGKACTAPSPHSAQSPQLSVERSAILVGHILVCSFCDTSAPVKLDQDFHDWHVDNFGLRPRNFLLPRTQSIARQVINCQVLDTATKRTICTCIFLGVAVVEVSDWFESRIAPNL